VPRSAVTEGEASRTLGSWVYERLRADIIAGELRPGQKLTLETLKDRYEVGITPLREALYKLSASLLVEAEDQRGFRVAPVNLGRLTDLISARQHIETLVLRNSIQAGDLAWEGEVLAAFHRLKGTRMYGDESRVISRAWEAAHRGFHLAILSAAPPSILLHFQTTLWDHAARYRNLVSPGVLKEDVLNREHEHLVSAVLARDEEMACILLKRHIESAAQPILAAVRGGALEREVDPSAAQQASVFR
jgi:GntR family carbon starvation induced transcriptional regulator